MTTQANIILTFGSSHLCSHQGCIHLKLNHQLNASLLIKSEKLITLKKIK